MKVLIRETDKLKAIVETFPEIWRGKVLDVGCRYKRLKDLIEWRLTFSHVPSFEYIFEYISMDIDSRFRPDIVADIAVWPGYEKEQFHTVAALDVLEHTNNICAAFEHICRMSSRYVIISLPNLYYWKQRINFLLGKNHSGKYGLPVIEGCKADRHKWLFTPSNARDFVYVYANAHGFRIREEICLAGPRFRHLSFLPKLWPDLFTRTYVALLERR